MLTPRRQLAVFGTLLAVSLPLWGQQPLDPVTASFLPLSLTTDLTPGATMAAGAGLGSSPRTLAPVAPSRSAPFPTGAVVSVPDLQPVVPPAPRGAAELEAPLAFPVQVLALSREAALLRVGQGSAAQTLMVRPGRLVLVNQKAYRVVLEGSTLNDLRVHLFDGKRLVFESDI